jgi:S1-C subfamily serine protease
MATEFTREKDLEPTGRRQVMSKKVIVVLACFLIIIGLLGGYCFHLSKEIAALTALQEDTNRQIGSVQDSINTLDLKIAVLKEETARQITGIGDEISALSTKIEDIPSAIDAKGLYQKVREGVVEVVIEAENGEEMTGSGFVFHSNLFIVTAYHVVKEADIINVILHDGTIIAADIMHFCPYSDIAVLRLEQAVATEPLTLGDSNATAIGEPVMAVGSPFELSGTVTSGIVSQKDRFVNIEFDIAEHGAVANLIQCDASVNFGNSGGPLINAKGEVIGLVVARVNPLEGDGVYYAVSANKLERVAVSIINHGSFDYPWVGVGLVDLSPKEAIARQGRTINGTLVTAILDGPAAPAGVRVDDIIIAIDGIPVNNMADFASYLGEHKSPQEIATLTIIRDGERLELPVLLDKRKY